MLLGCCHCDRTRLPASSGSESSIPTVPCANCDVAAARYIGNVFLGSPADEAGLECCNLYSGDFMLNYMGNCEWHSTEKAMVLTPRWGFLDLPNLCGGPRLKTLPRVAATVVDTPPFKTWFIYVTYLDGTTFELVSKFVFRGFTSGADCLETVECTLLRTEAQNPPFGNPKRSMPCHSPPITLSQLQARGAKVTIRPA